MGKVSTVKAEILHFDPETDNVQGLESELSEEELDEMVREAGAFDPSRLCNVNSAEATAMQAYMSGVSCYQRLTEAEERGLAVLVQRGIRSDTLLKSGIPMSDSDRELLEQNVRKGNFARDKLVTSNLRLAAYAAFRFRHDVASEAATDVMDAIQDGNLGLIHAAEIYDPTRRLRFSTCAMWWIRSAIDNGARNMKFPCKITYKVQTKINAVANAVKVLREAGEQTTVSNIAKQSGIKESDVSRFLCIATVSNFTDELQENTGFRDGISSCRAESSEFSDNIEDEVINRICREEIFEKMDALLSPTQATIVKQHFGFVEDTPLSLKEIGEQLGMSRAATHIAKKRALGRLNNRDITSALF